jgi:hypothetical protein
MLSNLRNKIFAWRVNAKIRKANRIRRETGYRCIVFMLNGRIIVKQRRTIKRMIREKVIKNITLEQFERKAIYITM